MILLTTRANKGLIIAQIVHENFDYNYKSITIITIICLDYSSKVLLFVTFSYFEFARSLQEVANISGDGLLISNC